MGRQRREDLRVQNCAMHAMATKSTSRPSDSESATQTESTERSWDRSPSTPSELYSSLSELMMRRRDMSVSKEGGPLGAKADGGRYRVKM